jgi:ribosomal protein L44E
LTGLASSWNIFPDAEPSANPRWIATPVSTFPSQEPIKKACDEQLLFALRRKLAKELGYDERGKPMQRRQLKAVKRTLQGGKCAICSQPLPEKNVVLDRLEAMDGYTEANTRLICRSCDYQVQESRGFA